MHGYENKITPTEEDILKEEKPIVKVHEFEIEKKANSVKKEIYDQVNVRLPIELNDWLNSIVRQTKRLHGSKIPKEAIIEASLRYLRTLQIDWTQISNKEDLLITLFGQLDEQ